jgi:hypothetical protein
MKIVCVINRAIVGKAIVYLNEDEYMVKFWRGKEFQRGAEYYTDDKEDAIKTAHAQLQHWVDLETR